jgi:hypothetical protein
LFILQVMHDNTHRVGMRRGQEDGWTADALAAFVHKTSMDHRRPNVYCGWLWLRGVSRKLPTQPSDRLEELIPDFWFADHPQARRKRAA